MTILSSMADHIITPKQTRLEKFKAEVSGFSPQVKAALITVSVTVAIALIGLIGGCISIYSENSSLKTKVHDLELEVLPFRNLAVQQFNRADAESMKRLAESMTTLHRDYSNQLETVNNLRQQIDQLRRANEETDRNLFSNAIYEKISSANTNRFYKRHTAEGAWRVIVKLKAVPIPGSFRGTIAGPYAVDDRTLPPNAITKNLFIQTFWGAWFDFPPDMPFNLEYVADSRETNLVKRIEFVNDDVVLLDGIPLRFK